MIILHQIYSSVCVASLWYLPPLCHWPLILDKIKNTSKSRTAEHTHCGSESVQHSTACRLKYSQDYQMNINPQLKIDQQMHCIQFGWKIHLYLDICVYSRDEDAEVRNYKMQFLFPCRCTHTHTVSSGLDHSWFPCSEAHTITTDCRVHRSTHSLM